MITTFGLSSATPEQISPRQKAKQVNLGFVRVPEPGVTFILLAVLSLDDIAIAKAVNR
jgi:hypothetical protein